MALFRQVVSVPSPCSLSWFECEAWSGDRDTRGRISDWLIIRPVPLIAGNKRLHTAQTNRTVRAYLPSGGKRSQRRKAGSTGETGEESAWVSLISDGATRVDYHQPAGLEVRR